MYKCRCSFQTQVYRNGEHVKKYEDDTAESQDLAASLPNAPLRVNI